MKEKAVGVVVKILSNHIKRYIEELVSISGITGVQGRILHYMIAQPMNEDIFQKDIEKEFHLRRSTATGILQLMEKNGIIKRTPVSYDARLKKIIVTDKALKIKNQVFEDMNNLEKTVTKGISENELALFFDVTEKMIKNLKNAENIKNS